MKGNAVNRGWFLTLKVQQKRVRNCQVNKNDT